MARVNKKSISIKNRAKMNWSRLVVLVEIAILGFVIIAVILSTIVEKISASTVVTVPSPSSRVDMLLVAYDFSTGRAIRRTDPLTMSLRTFLVSNVDSQGCPTTQPDYDTVVAATSDRQQLYISYGCGAANNPAYVVYSDGNWHYLSPTNEFSQLGFPLCSYLTLNNISAQIAPVCVDSVTSPSPQYTVRPQ
jgi:hypothetical protein